MKNQAGRGHVLIDSGPYAQIRRPFYWGLPVLLLGLALWLESYAGVIVLSVVLACLIARIRAEEKSLGDSLPGYFEYMTRVRHRLIPYVW